MNCGEVKDIIQLYMDNELDARSTLEVQRHLESCSSCSSLLNAFMQQDQALRKFARAQSHDNSALRESILAAIRRRPSRTNSRWKSPLVLRRVAAVAALAIVATLLLLLGKSPISDEVYAAVAADHAAHCTPDKLSMAVKDSDALDGLVAEYSTLKKTPDLSSFGFYKPCAKICRVNGVKVLHLVFQDSNEQGLSLFLRPHSSDLTVERLTVFKKDGVSIASISRSGVDLLVVSLLDEKQTSSIAQAIAAQL